MTIVDLSSRRPAPSRVEVLEGVVLDPSSPFGSFAATDLSTGTDGPLADVIAGAFATPVQYGHDDAAAVTARLVRALDAAGDALAFAAEVYREAWTGRADVALGYASWDVYVAEELGNLEALKIPREVRREIVATLHAAGMPKKKIARSLGVSDGITRKDLKDLEAERVAELEATTAPLALAPAPAPAPRSAIDRALEFLYGRGERGATAPELGRALPDVVDPGALLSVAHRYARVARLAVEEETGTREHQGRRFAVYLAAVDGPGKLAERVDFTVGRAVEAPGRRRSPRPTSAR